MRKPITFVLFLITTILFLSVFQIVISNRLSTTGIALNKMQEEIKQFKKENVILSEKLLVSSSLTMIASHAATMGFVEAKSQVFLSAPVPVAQRQ